MKRRRFDPTALPGRVGRRVDDRLRVATPLRGMLNKVFPDHWSFLFGEVALCSFIVLLLTGIYLALFFDASMTGVVYDGSYAPLRGTHMSAAFASTLDISFEVRGGLLIRQIHHWATLLLMAAIVLHLLRLFFTGAFRKPREISWAILVLLFWIGFLGGFTGYTLPDDAVSGTGLRIASAIILSIPIIGTWVATSLFNGEFPGDVIIGRLYVAHALLLPGILLAMFTALVALAFKHQRPHWPRPRRTNANVVGERLLPRYALKRTGLLLLTSGVLAVLGGLVQINPVWVYGQYRAAVVGAGSAPDWYLMFLDGASRLMPAWEITIPVGGGYAISPVFWAMVVPPGVLTLLALSYPFIEARLSKDDRVHHLLQRPRDVPARTALGAMAVAFYLVLTLSAANDVIAHKFSISLNAMIWAGRIGLLILPPLAYYVTYRICLGLQQHDRQVLANGVETGIIRRLPGGGFVEVHQPLGPTDGHARPAYDGRAVPKKMNRLGALAPAIKGFFTPIEHPAEAPVSTSSDEPDQRVGGGIVAG